mgnify:CR=1 FL=1
MPTEVLLIVLVSIATGGVVIGAALWGWVHTTKMKIQNGYPLENMWGMPIHPRGGSKTDERVTLLTQENAQLHAELGAVKDRLANVERIVTDSGYQLSHEIARLGDNKGSRQ